MAQKEVFYSRAGFGVFTVACVYYMSWFAEIEQGRA
jgi:hypothetical protein